MGWSEVASLDELPPDSSREFSLRGRVYVLFRVGEAITCLDGLCPHQGGRLAQGVLGGSVVTCPRLGCLRWKFDVLTGESPFGEPLRRRLYPVRVEGGSVMVDLPDA